MVGINKVFQLPKTKGVEERPLTEAEIEKYRQILQKLANEKHPAADHLREPLDCGAEDLTRTLAERLVASSHLDRESRKRSAIIAALAKIRYDNGEFGICIYCDSQIPRARLNAIAWAAACTACQEQADQEALSNLQKEAI